MGHSNTFSWAVFKAISGIRQTEKCPQILTKPPGSAGRPKAPEKQNSKFLAVPLCETFNEHRMFLFMSHICSEVKENARNICS